MVTAPPIEGNSDCRARLPGIFSTPVAMDFYQSMTTQAAQSPTAIYFSIDGRQGILEARHIAEALHIPYQPEDPTHFRQYPTLSVATIVESISLLTNGHSWWDELPTESIPPTPTAPSMPEATSTDPPTTPPAPPVAPPTSEASITISATEFRAMIQQHLRLLPPPHTDIPGLLKPIALAEETTPVEETTRADVPSQATHEAATEPSSPSESPAP
ncbi:hypothetical protein AAG906_021036 [Vitis piasezkii]